MANLILTGLILAIFLFFALLGAFLVVYRLGKRRISEVITDFVSSPGVGLASPFATIVDSASKTAGHSIAMEVKTTLMGKASVASKNEAAIMSDIAGDQLNQQMPLMSGLLDTMPTLKKRLLKNPGLLQSLAGVFANSSNSTNSTNSNPSNGGGSVDPNRYNKYK